MKKKISRSNLNNARRYTLINYFDVWKNEEGGWTVNNSFVEFDDLYISNNATDKEILTYLYEVRYLSTNDMRKVRIDDYSDGFEIYQVKGWKPLFAIIPTVICN